MKNQKTVLPSSQDKWRRIIEAQAASGRSIAAYCRGRRIGQASFYAWKKRLKPSSASGVSSQSVGTGFVELTAARETAASPPAGEAPAVGPSLAGIEIIVNGRRIRVRPGFNHELLGEVLAVLEEPEDRA